MRMLALLTTIVLAACGQAPPLSPEAPTPTEPPTPRPTATAMLLPTSTSMPSLSGSVRLWLDWNPDEMSALQRAVESFLNIHPEVEFEVVYYPPERLLSEFREAVQRGDGPDLIFGPSDWGPALFEERAIQDPSDMLLPGLSQTIHPLAWNQVRFRGITLGLPLEFQGVVLYRNRDLVPAAAQTLEEFVEAAAAVRQAGGVGAALDIGFTWSAPQIAVCGGEWLDPQGTYALDAEVGLCWLNLHRRLREAGPVTLNTDDDLILFQEARAGWLIDETTRLDLLRSSLGDEVLAIDAWPVNEGTDRPLTGYVWTENAYFSEDSTGADLEASISFVTFLLLIENQMAFSQMGGARHIPVLQDVEIADPLLGAARLALESGSPRPLHSDLEPLRDPFETALRLVVTQGGDPELALQLAAQEVSRSLEATATPSQ